MLETRPPETHPSIRSPYRGLIPYSEKDAPYFFGRDRDRQVISANLQASRLTLLYGASGVGKTSVLYAGVIHDLRRRAQSALEEFGSPEFVVVELSSWSGDPIAALGEAVRRSVAGLLGDRAPDLAIVSGPLDEMLRAWSRSLDADLLVVLDQFEEYFLYHGDEDGEGTFAVQFPRAINAPGLRANFLVSLREDALARMDRFKGRIPGLFGNYLRLNHLGREAARAAIEMPVERYNRSQDAAGRMSIEPSLLKAVLDEVRAGEVTVGHAGEGVVAAREATEDRIETPYLQLVMSRLWDEETTSGSDVLRLETLERLGGASRIVRTHLDEAMADLSAAERDISAKAFRFLVTPSGTKIAHEAGDLAEYADVPVEQLAPVLEELSGKPRILRVVAAPPGAGGESRYEIFHDVLATAVLDWRGRYEQAGREAEAAARIEEEKREAERRARTARRRARRLSILAGASLAFAVAVGGLAFWALDQRSAARSQEIAATALATLSLDPAESLRLALEALEVKPTAQAEEALRRALPENRVRAAFTGHTDRIRTVAFDPTGTRVVTASWDGTARIWETGTGRELQVLKGNPEDGPLADAAFDPDSSRVVTAREDGVVQLWDARTGREILEFEGHEEGAETVEFDPDGDRIVTAGWDDTARIWDASTGDTIHVLRGHEEIVYWATFSPDGERVATASRDGTTRLWDTSTGKQVFLLDDVFDGWVRQVVFSPNGKLVASARSDGWSYAWNTSTGNLEETFCCHDEEVGAVAFSPDGKFLVTGGDKSVQVFEVDGGILNATMLGHTDWVRSVAFSPDGRTVVSASDDGTARVWETNVGRELFTLTGHTGPVMSAVFNPEGTRVVTVSSDETARVWDPGTGTQLRGHTYWVLAADFSPDGELVATASSDGTARLWNSHTGRELDKLPSDGRRRTDLSFEPRGSRVAVASEDGYVYLWDRASDDQPESCCYNQGWSVLTVAFSPDADQIIVTYADYTARIWDVASGEQVGAPLEEGQSIEAVFSRDGQRILTLSRLDKMARIWDAATGKVLLRLRGHTGDLNDVAFSRDGSRVVTGSSDRTARIWEAETGEQLLILRGSTGDVTTVAFSPDGSKVLGGGEDGMVRVWDAATGRLLGALPVHADFVNDAEFSPDGKVILSASDDFTAKIFPCTTCVPLEDVIALARRALRIERAAD
jgi:WD40 repeat protein